MINNLPPLGATAATAEWNYFIHLIVTLLFMYLIYTNKKNCTLALCILQKQIAQYIRTLSIYFLTSDKALRAIATYLNLVPPEGKENEAPWHRLDKDFLRELLVSTLQLFILYHI